MATRTATHTDLNTVRKAVWTGLLTGDVGNSVELGRLNDRGASAQAVGTFGAGGSIQMQGSNDGTTWFNLAAIPTTGNIVALGGIVPHLVRPSVVSGDGTTNIAVHMVW